MEDSDSVKSGSFQSNEDGSFETTDSEVEQSSDDDDSEKIIRQVAADPAALAAALSRPLSTTDTFRFSHQISSCPETRRLPEANSFLPETFSEDVDDVRKNPMWIARARRLEHKWRCYDAQLVAFSLTRDIRKDQSSDTTTISGVDAGPLDPASASPAAAGRSLRFRLNGASSRCVHLRLESTSAIKRRRRIPLGR